jgi:hypothetical protein
MKVSVDDRGGVARVLSLISVNTSDSCHTTRARH